jgi:hypothetical protein
MCVCVCVCVCAIVCVLLCVFVCVRAHACKVTHTHFYRQSRHLLLIFRSCHAPKIPEPAGCCTKETGGDRSASETENALKLLKCPY